MAKADKKKIDIPASAASKELDRDFIIHVMPKEFKGKAADVRKLSVVAKPIPPPVKIAPKPVPIKKKADTKKKGRRSTLILILVGVIIVLLFLVSALFILRSLQEETIVEVPVEVPVEKDPAPVEEKIRQGLDTDSDGLTDVEEELYGTDFRNPDTDADSFLDGNEVFHRYDPIGYAPSTLLDTGSVEIYESVENNGYNVYYPHNWRVQESFDPGTGITSEVQFVASTRSTISISAFEKDEGTNFTDWYESSVKEGSFDSLLNILSKEGYVGYMSQDKFTAYLDTEEFVYLFIYDLKNEKSIEYLQTFQMMVNSFILP